jgi:GT2 family glycosyltransferase
MAGEYLVTIVIVTYNSAGYVEACINSIYARRSRAACALEIVVVDNHSSDDTVRILKERFPSVQLLENDENYGWGRANNQGVARAAGDFIVILNPDTLVEEGWLDALIQPLIGRRRLLTTPKILIYDGSTIGNCGNILHFTGLAFTRGYGADKDACTVSEPVSYVSGCCFAVRRDEFLQLDGFDEALFLYHDDLDFTCKAYLAGFESLYVPMSIIRHDYRLDVDPEKFFLLEKGRYVFLRKYLSTGDLLRFAPSLVVSEVLSFGFAGKLGVRGVLWKLRAAREGFFDDVPKLRGDKENLFKHFSRTIPSDQLTTNCFERAGVRLANRIFVLNYGPQIESSG